jgi:hypothetical protein
LERSSRRQSQILNMKESGKNAMAARKGTLRITTRLDNSEGIQNSSFYRDEIRHTLLNIFPPSLLSPALNNSKRLQEQRRELRALLPLFVSQVPTQTLETFSAYLVVATCAPPLFFFDMVRYGLIPGKQFDILACCSVNFQLPDYGEDFYTLYEVVVRVEGVKELKEIERYLPRLKAEVCIGVKSTYDAHRVLEGQDLSADMKGVAILEKITSVRKRLPKAFGQDLIVEMQHVVLMTSEPFKTSRKVSHLTRIIGIHYLFRKALDVAVNKVPNKRHLSLKLFRAHISGATGNRPVVGVIVGINFLRDKELFEERHVLSAIQSYVPTAQVVAGSFFSNRKEGESICLLYLEIEKQTPGQLFTSEEIALLRRELPTDLKDRIEYLVHPIFMPRNEEELMRNIFTLSNQVKYLHDLPQVVISFDKQMYTELFFTAIIVRAFPPGSPSLQQIFQNINSSPEKKKSSIEYTHERSKTIGYMRKKYSKEAAVLAIKVLKEPFLRRDHSIDLGKARQAILLGLTELLGEVRDFNGGMLSQQHEKLGALREELGTTIKYNDLFLENFFYSLAPGVMRTVLHSSVLKTFFLFLVECAQEALCSEQEYEINVRCDPEYVYVVIRSEEGGLKERIGQALSNFSEGQTKVAISLISAYEVFYLGYLYMCSDTEQQQVFCRLIQDSLANHEVRSDLAAQDQVQSLP